MRISSFVIALFDNVFITVFTIVVFYRISDLDRRDVIKYEFSVPQSVVSPKPEKTEKTEAPDVTERSEGEEEKSPEVKRKKSSGRSNADKGKKQGGKPRKKSGGASDGAKAKEDGDVV